jgi:HAE1 family hydrophobic/amphiphilic exporter-1
MIRYFAVHPTAANILMIAIILLGLANLPNLNRETFPNIDSRQVSVTIPYPGASPLEVEEGICNPLEDATDGISFMEERRCEARDNLGRMVLEMQESGDIRRFLDDVQSAIDGITELPDEAEEPVIEELGRTAPVLSVAVSADLSRRELKVLTEYYRDELLSLPYVPIVTVSGFSTQELRVEVKPEALGQYQLSVQDIALLTRDQATDLPAGIVEGTEREYQLRFSNARRTAEELADLVIISNDRGGQVRLGDIATITDGFVDEEVRSEINGHPAGILQISKNLNDDTLKIFDAVNAYIAQENARLPDSTRLVITEDHASIVQDRLSLLLKNGWQGLLLATLALLLFFSWRYTFWIALGLPISFLGGLVVMSGLGISINMISLVALLMAIGILMDDAIVLSESIASERASGKSPLEAAVDGVSKVARGVTSSFITSALLFGSLLFLKGDMGQVMRVLPIVLLSVLTLSLIEAFLILPHHLKNSLEYGASRKPAAWRQRFDRGFEKLRAQVGRAADWSIKFRYPVVGGALALLIISISIIPAGILKFKFFPDLEGNVLEARVLMPQGTPLQKTESVVNGLLASLHEVQTELPPEPNGQLIKNIRIDFSENGDSGEEGPHLATISLDILDAELRETSLNVLRRLWMERSPLVAEAISIQFKEPVIGPAGKAISIRLEGEDLEQLSTASWKLQNWLNGYRGVSNVMDDLRPGKPQFSISLLPGALGSGLDSRAVSSQLRAAYQGMKVDDVYQRREAYEINVKLANNRATALADLAALTVFNRQGESLPLAALATLQEQREFARVTRVDYRRTVTIIGDIDNDMANTNEVISDTRLHFLPELLKEYPGLRFSLEGEVKNSEETNSSVVSAFFLGIAGVFLLLSFQFRNFREPLVVLVNIPLALIGVIWGHWLMGLDLTMPSMIGFVSLSGVVVNDSILLVEFVKLRSKEGMSLHAAAGQAVRDRFRAIFLTSVTTVAGMLPLLSETSLQAQVLVPMVTSITFGMVSSTVLLLLVLPAAYAILEELGFVELDDGSADAKPAVAI